MSEKFREYKRKLRWKSGMRKLGAAPMEEPQMRCPQCGQAGEFTMGSQFCCPNGHLFDKFPVEQFKQDMNALPETQHPTENWEPEGWNAEAYGPHGRCPMCKNPNMLELDGSLICPECNWAGESGVGL